MRLSRAEKEIILDGLKALWGENAYWGDEYEKECERKKLQARFEKELS